MTIALCIAAAILAAGYLAFGARHWSRMMSIPATTAEEAAFDAALARRDLRVRIICIAFLALWPAFLALGAINAAIEDRRPA